MEISIKGTPDEIAALVLAIQGRQGETLPRIQLAEKASFDFCQAFAASRDISEESRA